MSEKVTNPLSNYSYINKDFNAVWSELLDIVGKLSAKWDPNASNESDPGVVLIKLIALLADKCNYNIDTNILELFPSTVSQTANAREIFEQLGYSMRWYRSGTGEVLIRYQEEKDITNSEEGTTENSTQSDIPETITIPQFTMISDVDVSTIYTIIEEKEIPTDGSLEPESFKVMQGIIQDYTILGERKITADQLDNHYRLYFNENTVAENGIFITDADIVDYTQWKKVDNLPTQDLLSKVYKFGVTRDNICYLEFPTDIATIIPEGIYIKYLISDGMAGNVAKNVLEQYYNNPSISYTLADGTTSELVLNSDNNVIVQSTAIINGQDPETIDEAYSNYIKTVGVFNTLVSLRDYTNAIYTVGNENGWVSNGIVTDRTNDIQSSYKIITNINGVEGYKVQTVIKDDGTYNMDGSTGTMSALLRNPYEHDILDYNSLAEDCGCAEAFEDGHRGPVELGLMWGTEAENPAYRGIAQEAPQNIDSGLIDTDLNKASLTLRDRDIGMDDYEITPFDLKLYLLNYSDSPASSVTNYNHTFTLVMNNEGDKEERISNIVKNITGAIDDYKSIQHEFKPLLNNRPCIFLNKYPVKALIVPQYKLTAIQSVEIKSNIYQALFSQYNSQKVEFGQEITYDEVYDTIMGADERIKSVILQPLDYKTYVVYFDPDDTSDSDLGSWKEVEFDINTRFGDVNDKTVDNHWGIDCFAKSVLAGTTDLYKKDTAFKYALNQNVRQGIYGQDIAQNIKSVTTVSNIKLGANTPYTLKANENIYIQSPNYEDNTTYSSSVAFEYYFEDGTDAKANAIPSDSDYCIKGESSYLIVYWKSEDKDTFYNYKVYKKKTVIKPVGFSMDKNIRHTIATTDQIREQPSISIVPLMGTKWKTEPEGRISLSTSPISYNILTKYWGKTQRDPEDHSAGGRLSATTNIIIRTPKEIKTDYSYNNYYYWLLNKKIMVNGKEVFRLFDSVTDDTQYQSYQLKTNEFLLVCNKDLTGMSIFGSGTKIERSGADLKWTWEVPVTDVTDLNNIGVEVLKDVWTSLPDKGEKLSIAEMRFIALGENAVIKSDLPLALSSKAQAIPLDPNTGAPTTVYYKSDYHDDQFTEIRQMDLSKMEIDQLHGWSIYSNLNVDFSSESPQVVYPGQKIICTDISGNNYSFECDPSTNIPVYVQSSESIGSEGGENIDISLYNPYTDTTTYTNIYAYTKTEDESEQIGNNKVTYQEFGAKLVYDTNTNSIPFNFKLPAGTYIIPIKIMSTDIENLNIRVAGEIPGVYIKLLNTLAPNTNITDDSGHVTEVSISGPTKNEYYYISIEFPIDSATLLRRAKLTISIGDHDENKIIYMEPLFRYIPREYTEEVIDECGNVVVKPKYYKDLLALSRGEYGTNHFFEDVLKRMQSLDYDGLYNFIHEIPEEDYIEDPLDPRSFLKENHIYNKFTICQINISNDNGSANDIVITKNIK